jgi:methionine-rich copper-binding protein CopC
VIRALPAAAVAVIACAVVMATSAPAEAHNYLVDSTPVDGSTLTELPEQFSVTTNEPLLDLSGDGAGFAIEVVDAHGMFYGDGCVSITDATLATGAALGAAGDYRMLWQLVSEDGHTVSGEIPFRWDPADTEVASTGVDTAPTCGGEALAAPGESVAPRVVSLADVLWIGGAVLAIILAAAVTFLVLSRQNRRQG